MLHLSVQALTQFHHWDGSPEELVRKLCRDLLDEAQESCPVDLDVLGSFRGVTNILEVNQDQAGLINRTDGGYEIRVRASDPLARRRFTIAHEIVHTHFLEATGKADHVDHEVHRFQERHSEEFLCDVGAAELLLPASDVLSRLTPPARIEAVQAAASELGASIEATGLRLVQLTATWAAIAVLSLKLKTAEILRFSESWLPGLEPQSPTRKMRVDWAWCNGGTYIPKQKSVDDDCPLSLCIAAGPVNYIGRTGLVDREVHVTAAHLPYSASESRVIALLWEPT